MKKLLLMGVLALLAIGCNKTQPVQQNVSSEVKQNQASTADWKTYQDTNLGFEFKYPADLTVLASGTTQINLTVRPNKYSGSFAAPGLIITDTDAAGEFKLAAEGRVFDASKAKNELVRNYFTDSGKKFYASCALYIEPSIINTCNQILATFKFTSSSDIAVYNGKGFSFSYPKEWSIGYFNNEVRVLDKTPRDDSDLPANITFALYGSTADLEKVQSSLSLKGYLDQNTLGSSPLYSSVQPITLAGKSAFKAQAGPNNFGGGTYYFIQLDNKNVLRVWDFSGNSQTEVILNSLKFS